MNKYIKIVAYFSILSSLYTPLILRAQETQSSVLSRYGYGVLSDPTPTPLKGMGGVGIALSSPKYINLLNPAAYASTDSLSFLMDIAVSTNFGKYADEYGTKRTFLGNFDHLAFQFPLWKNKVAMSLGVLPFSTTGYGLQSTLPITNNTEGYTITQSFEGTGSIQSLYAGIGAEVYQGLRVGMNIRHLFGRTTHSVTNTPSSALISSSRDSHVLHLKGLLLDFGMQYSKQLEKEQVLSVGISLSPSLPIHPHITQLHEENFGSVSFPQITQEEKKLATKSPLKAGLGLMWEKEQKLTLATDIQYTNWSKIPNIFQADGVKLKDTYKIAIGTQYRPDAYSRKYWERMYYRGGANFKTTYSQLPTIGQMNKLTFALGLGLPISVTDERISYVDLALEYTKGLPTGQYKLHEDYIGLTLSLNFNETWFRQLKIY